MLLTSALLGCVIGAAGTALGGVLALLIGKKSDLSRPLMAFAGGLMIAVVFFDMLTEAAHLGGILVMCGGAVFGGVLFAFVSALLPRSKRHSMAATGWMVLIGIAMHNIPEGIAVGSSLVESERLAFFLGLLLMLHNVPEGMAVCAPLRLSGMASWKIIGLALLTGLPTAAGAVIGTLAGSISRGVIAFCIAFAGGAMLYISLKELIPAAGASRTKNTKHLTASQKKAALAALLGLCVGFVMTTVIPL